MADAVLENLEMELRDHKPKGKSSGKSLKKASDKTINIAGPSSSEGNDSNEKTPNSTVARQDDTNNPVKFNELRETVDKLSATMNIFMQKIMEDEIPIGSQEQFDLTQLDETPPSKVTENKMSGDDMLAEMAAYYDSSETVSTKIDEKLSTVVKNIMANKLTEEKLKEKMALYSRPDNCEQLICTKVNPEIWDKLLPAARSRDLKMQRLQASLIKGMIPILQTTSTLVELSRSGETLSADKMATITKSMINSLALLANSNQELDQRRRELLRPDLNEEFKELCSSQSITKGALLFGQDLSTRIKQIQETNKLTTKLNPKSGIQQTYRPERNYRGIAGSNSGRWKRSFRSAFLEKRPPFVPTRGQSRPWNKRRRPYQAPH